MHKYLLEMDRRDALYVVAQGAVIKAAAGTSKIGYIVGRHGFDSMYLMLRVCWKYRRLLGISFFSQADGGEGVKRVAPFFISIAF